VDTGQTQRESSVKRTSRRKTLWWALLVIFVAGLFLYVLHNPKSETLWVNPSEVEFPSHNKLLEQLRARARKVAGPLVNLWRRHKVQIQISASVLTVTNLTSQELNLGKATSVNGGVRVWILSPENLRTLLPRLQTNPCVMFRSRIGVLSESGGSAKLQGQSSPGKPGRVPITTLDFLPTAFSDTIKLTTAITLTETVDSSGFVPNVETNLSVALRTTIPNGGALVMDAGKPTSAFADHYWLVIAPVLVDSFGKLIKH
jgi:hypothetical protein